MKVKLLLKDGTTMEVEDVVNYSIHTAAPPPTEDIPFEVNYKGIDQSLFEKARSDREQEKTRQIILEAFAEVDKYPEKYASPFDTLMPKKTKINNIKEMKMDAYHLGGHVADWVEQALEWAQRISNGESWEFLCNYTDSASWFRVISWKDDLYRLVGGSSRVASYNPASAVKDYPRYISCDAPMSAVPLVAIRKK